MGNHTANCALEEEFGSPGTNLLGRLNLLAANISGVAGVNFLGFFVAAQTDLFCVDDYNVVSGVNMGSEDRLVFSPQKASSLYCDFSKDCLLYTSPSPRD